MVWLIAATPLASRPAPQTEASGLAPLEPDRISLRVLDEGRLLGEAEVRVSIERWSPSRNHWQGSSRDEQITDPGGRLDTKLGWQEEREGSDPTELRVTVAHGNRFGELRAPHVRGVTELGDLALGPMPVLAAGRVLDRDGTPVSEAEIFVVEAHPVGTSTWHLETGTVVTDPDGAFVLHTPRKLEEGPLRLLARRDEWLSPVTLATEGTRDLTLVLSVATGGLTGRVWVDPGIPPERITVQLYADELGALAPGRGLFELDSRPDADGHFTFVGRVPGRHRVRVLAGGSEVFTLPDVIVAPGTPGTDPRLDPVDLRGRLHARRIRLVVPGEAVLPEGFFVVHCTGKVECASEFFRGPELLVLSSDPDPDLEVFPRDFRSLRLEKVSADRSVPLEPGWPIRLVLDDDIALPEPPVTWLVTLKSHPASWMWTSPIEFAPGRREARGMALQTGELEVGWTRRVGAESLPVFATFGGRRGWPRQTVQVRDVPGEQVLRLGWVPVPR